MPNSLIVQVGFIFIAGVIFVMFIQPTIAEIRVTQDNTATYIQEIERVAGVNRLLAENVSRINSLPVADAQALERYLPAVLDEAAIMRDITYIFSAAEVALTSLTFGGVTAGASERAATAPEEVDGEEMSVGATGTLAPVSMSFDVAFAASYEKIKETLALIERNTYLLEVAALDLAPDAESGDIAVTMTLRAYGLSAPATVEVASE